MSGRRFAWRRCETTLMEQTGGRAPCACSRARAIRRAKPRRRERMRTRACDTREKGRLLPKPGDGSTGTAGEQEGHWRSGSIMRKNYRCKKKTVLALIRRHCQIAVVRFGVCRFRANGVENDGVTPKRGKSGRSERGGKPREGTQPGCRKPEERPPRPWRLRGSRRPYLAVAVFALTAGPEQAHACFLGIPCR